jgi:acylphosphatase
MAAAVFLVSGRVQGVYFRASTREQALRLGLSGHARNLEDGCVEVLAVGEADAIARLAQWLRTGPPMAQVADVVRGEYRGPDPAGGFEVL